MDMIGLMERIPDLRERAGRWIHAFEEETVGHLLAIGDIKAILSRSFGVGEMREMLEGSLLHRLTFKQSQDGDLFNACRPGLWQHLR